MCFTAVFDAALIGWKDPTVGFVGLGQYNAHSWVGGVKRVGWGDVRIELVAHYGWASMWDGEGKMDKALRIIPWQRGSAMGFIDGIRVSVCPSLTTVLYCTV